MTIYLKLQLGSVAEIVENHYPITYKAWNEYRS